VNLAQRFPLGGIRDPFGIHARLRTLNPAPYAGWFAAPRSPRSPAFHLVSCSPELLVETRGDLAVTCPIAGTFPRGLDPTEDAALLARLAAHPKERAEHVMLVDLERNDLGRVAVPGTVAVPELLGTRTLATVHHLVSTVICRLRPDASPRDVLAAVFPGGTITGCPKVAAARLIRALEPVARGPYTGALGFVDACGDMAFNILIRTLVVSGERAWIHGGAGVVWDSIPEREWRECVQKVKAFLALLGIETTGLDLASFREPQR
jgi:anthranilate synthase component 1